MTTKPSLTIMDYGVNNADLEASRARILRGGSWKRQRICVILPTGDMLSAKTCLSLWNLQFPPNNGVVRILAQGMEVGDAYSTAIEQILGHPDLSTWEFVLTVEHDAIIPSDGIIKMIEHLETHPELSAVSGLYWTKGPGPNGVGGGGAPQIWGDPADPQVNFRPQAPRLDIPLQECVGLGMGTCLFRLSMFKDERIKRPWFRTVKGPEGLGTQDLAFWTEAKKYGYRCAVALDVKCGHHDVKGDFGIPDMVW